MKPQRFYPGQSITKKEYPGRWETWNEDPVPGPAFGQIVRVEKYLCFYGRKWYVALVGYEGGWIEDAFDPIIPDDVLEQELSEITVKV